MKPFKVGGLVWVISNEEDAWRGIVTLYQAKIIKVTSLKVVTVTSPSYEPCNIKFSQEWRRSDGFEYGSTPKFGGFKHVLQIVVDHPNQNWNTY